MAGEPGFAFWLAADDTTSDRDYTTAAGYAGRIVAAAVAQGLTRDLLLNVNVPCRPAAEIKGIRVTRLGLRVYRDRLDERRDPRGVPYYWIGGDYPPGAPDAGTGFQDLRDGYVSVTPLHPDLPGYPAAARLRTWGREGK